MHPKIRALVPVVLLGVAIIPFLLTWRDMRLMRLNQVLIATIKSMPTPDAGVSSLAVYKDEHTCTVVQSLLSKGADPNARDSLSMPQGFLWHALRDRLFGKASISLSGPTCLLMSLQSWEYVAEENRWVPGYTHRNGSRLAMILLENGADINARACQFDSSSDTPLLAACQTEKWDFAYVLVEHGANVNLTGKSEISALLMAAHANATEMVRILVQHGANVNVSDPDTDWTALWYAISNQNMRMTQILLSAHANPNRRGRDGKTPLEYARSLPHRHSASIVALLEGEGAKE